MGSHQLLYQPRCYYYRLIFHREPSAETVRTQGFVLCQDSEKVIKFARDIGLAVPDQLELVINDAREAFIDRYKDMAKVRWFGLELCRLIEPLYDDIRDFGRLLGVDLDPPKFYHPPTDEVQALMMRPWGDSLAG
ncbi:hypothetical protein [Rubellicoccus peritrichatus]|uniref:Uncharacterized protein n=1 Tax=Rubellicoccus peritrichatus TaxID=3080537 RepID=A0AAQ3QX32_9BACT|nr:hypothetical protein [Puniceicoccus sp. CR14]WOO43263.1 hypothetical protein RZN69_09190 [Puniceicoccus sp. CR14]